MGRVFGDQHDIEQNWLDKCMEDILQYGAFFVYPLDGDISLSELCAAIQKLKVGKACGADDIPAELFRNLPEAGISRLLRLFNLCLNQASVPTAWFYQEIILILKSGGDDRYLSQRRPLSIVDTVTKLFELVFHGRFVSVLGGELHEEQAGSQRHRSCPEQLFSLMKAIELAQASGRYVLALFLDVVKAFDSVDHRALFVALWRDGMRGKSWLLFQRWYDNLEAAVRWGVEPSLSAFLSSMVHDKGGCYHRCSICVSLMVC
eukprot:Lithocolla_globosa_v1_NODE_2657_length_1917_cov_4.679914.p1 type:complete len:261 gc:universal NODE_2657_length_1917_cov_4.679914:457-1239(+)